MDMSYSARFPIPMTKGKCCFVPSSGAGKGMQCRKPCYKLLKQRYDLPAGTKVPVCYSHITNWGEARAVRKLNECRHERNAFKRELDEYKQELAKTMKFFDDRSEKQGPLALDLIPEAIQISEYCSVCIPKIIGLVDDRLILPCQHVVCFECYCKVEDKCPVCHFDIVHTLVRKACEIEDEDEIGTDDEEDEEEEDESKGNYWWEELMKKEETESSESSAESSESSESDEDVWFSCEE